MKKLLMLLAVAVFMLGITGQAMAFFEDGHLIRVVYDVTGTIEVATDLGAMESVLRSATTTNYVFNTNNFSLGQFGGSTDFANLNVEYVMRAGQPNGFAANSVWTTGPQTGQTSGNRTFNGFDSAFNYFQGLYYSGGTGPAMAAKLKSDPNSYWTRLNFGSTANLGSYAGFLSAPHNNGEASLAALETTGYVDQWIYYYTGLNALSGTKVGTQVAMIRTYADGHTEINPVPIPAAVYLLGSGLLGLIGIRRRMMA